MESCDAPILTSDASTGQRVRVSLVINTLDEEPNIAACIQSVGNYADEVVVVDMHSDDRTAEIAEKLGARVILRKREPYVEKARRFAVEQARGEWVLILDADERATPALLDELKAYTTHEDINVVQLRMTQLFMGKFLEHGAYSKTTLFRFFRRSKYLKAAPPDSEASMHTGRPRGLVEIPGQVVANNRFVHLAHPTLDKYVRKMLLYYSLQEAIGWHSQKSNRPSLRRLILWPTKAFIGSYFYHQGFLDGLQGFVSSIVWATSRFLVQAHLYDLEEGRREDDPWAGMVSAPKGYTKEMEAKLTEVNSITQSNR